MLLRALDSSNTLSGSSSGTWLKHVLVFSMVFLLLNLRPAMLQSVGEVIFLLSCGAMVFFIMMGFRMTINRPKKIFLALIFALCLYILCQGVLLGTGVRDAALKNMAFVVASSVAVLFISRRSWNTALKGFVYPTLVFSVSYLITGILVLVLRIPLISLEWYSFLLPQGERFYDISIYFPFSIALGYGGVKALGLDFARALGYFREPGIFQVMVIFSFFGLNYLDIKYKVFWKSLLVFTLFITFSTAGYGAFIATALAFYMIAGKGVGKKSGMLTSIVFLLSLIPLSYWFVFSPKQYGLLKKLSFASGSVRVDNIAGGMDYFFQNPLFGAGYMNPNISSISFASMIGQLGGIGVLLLLLIILLPNWDLFRKRDPVLVLIIPSFLTMLLAQPLFDKPLFFLTLAMIAAYPREEPPKPGWVKKYSSQLLKESEERKNE